MKGVLSFIIVLLLMPIGHALMVFNELTFPEHMYLGAFVIGGVGVALLALGVKLPRKYASISTLLGLLAGVLVWTGWVEFSFVWIAHKLSVSPLIENGEVATKPEYLVMMSSLGLLGSIGLFFLYTPTRCQFINWFQRLFGYKKLEEAKTKISKPTSVTTFIETIFITWTFYLVLLLVYDKDIAGDRHPLTYVVAYGSLIWAAYLFIHLLSIKQFDYAIRYAVPTVIIFWNFIEILGRWDTFKEIWVYPYEHWIEVTLMCFVFAGFTAYYVVSNFKSKSKYPKLAK